MTADVLAFTVRRARHGHGRLNGRAVADRTANTLCGQSAASQCGRHREDHRLHPKMGVDQPGPGGRTRRADRRSRQGRRRSEVGADDTNPGGGTGASRIAFLPASLRFFNAQSETARGWCTGDVSASSFNVTIFTDRHQKGCGSRNLCAVGRACNRGRPRSWLTFPAPAPTMVIGAYEKSPA
jgi:hypothetical protein